MLPVHTILFPTDFSESAKQAFALACSLARDCGARLIVLHVVPPPVGHDELLARRNPHEYYGGVWRALRDLRAPDQNINVEHILKEGEPAQRILATAEDVRAGLIVIGTHGRTGLGRVLLGSVAEQVLRKAECPVLTVRMPRPAMAAEHDSGA
jgi:nucleotide-binding universal stress UspA family protein